ncbi:MAG: 50S ribosome-binding GTPase [Planctomycetes bacterium]|nr:50S ribosome-binding GTPase [Planctomycetota bacterium]MBL7185810.1 50S ribosome-binding GTPase [Phycisphaerae bacterium]
MNTHAALMTGKGTGAISTIEIFGDCAQDVLRKIFEPAGTRPVQFKPGDILLGTIRDDVEVIDQVTLGCEGPDTFAIHCHGNPLIVEVIMQLLGKHGASLVTAEQLLAKTLAAQELFNTIAIEAKLAQTKAKTIEGTKIIANQIGAGLSEKAQTWLDGIEEVSLDQIKAEAVRILRQSQAARLIMYGLTAVLTGPPNSGKSTLLNFLAGRQKAIVTDIKGTTRDWVEATCQIAPLSVTLIDTAGLDEQPSEPQRTVEQAAREKTTEILDRVDLVLLVLDGSGPAEELDGELIERICDKQVITVLNKSDLPGRFDAGRLPKFLSEPVRISAKEGTGIKHLTETIRQTSGTIDFNLQQPVCFTDRQENLLTQLTNTEFKRQAVSITMDLLDGQV